MSSLFPAARIVVDDLHMITGADLPFHELDGRTVLITGATGFVASYLIEALLFRNKTGGSAGTKVVGLARNRERADERFGGYLGRVDFELLIQDVAEPIVYDQPIDFIIHAASQASPKYFGSDPVGTQIANSVGTYNLLRLAAKVGTRRFVFVSSGEVYGETSRLPNPIGEHDFGPLDPVEVRSCYGEGKRAGENLSICWGHQYGLSVSIARLSHTYGPGMRLDDGRVFADFVANAVAGTDIVLNSDGTATRPFCYLTDACVGLLTILLKGESGVPYNLANDDAVVSIGELAEIVCRLSPTPGVKPVFKSRDAESTYLASPVRGSIPDTSRLRSLGWKPTVSIEEGFRRTIQSYLSPA